MPKQHLNAFLRSLSRRIKPILKDTQLSMSDLYELSLVAAQLRWRALAKVDPTDVRGNLLALSSVIDSNAVVLARHAMKKRSSISMNDARQNILKAADALAVWARQRGRED